MSGHNIFEERADYLDDSEINAWTASSTRFLQMVGKACERSTLLFVGPRGCGKTHLFRYAHMQCRSQQIFSVYTSFGGYYSLEPLLSTQGDARKIFHVWVLSQIIIKAKEEFEYRAAKAQKAISEPWFSDEQQEQLRSFIALAEKGLIRGNSSVDDVLQSVSIANVSKILKTCSTQLGDQHVILFLDDAALTLTPDYLVEFFDIVRSLKNKITSIKAAVYPGTTEYGPRFHVGQDAQTELVWIIENNKEDSIINQMIVSRLQDQVKSINPDILSLLKHAAFGMPRAFLNLLRAFTNEAGNPQVKFNAAIDYQTDHLLKEYKSITIKLSQYEDIIYLGGVVFETIIKQLKNRNVDLVNSEEVQLVFGIQQEETDTNLLRKRMFQFLVEAGLLYPQSSVNHGPDRVYDRFQPHTAFLLKERSFSGASKGFNASEIVAFLSRPITKHPERTTLGNLVADKDLLSKLHLNLPPCRTCTTPRVKESQRYCYNCGAQMVNESKFNACLDIAIENLPFTPWRRERIKETELRTIRDFLTHPNTAQELQQPFRMGPSRAQDTDEKIRAYIREFLS